MEIIIVSWLGVDTEVLEKRLTTGFSRNKKGPVALANSHGVNNPTMANFKLPT